MYNEERKREFLKTVKSENKRYALKGFEYTEDWEEACNDDICNIPIENIINYIVKKDKTSSLSVVDKFYMAIKKYKMWALHEGLVDPDALDTCVMKDFVKVDYVEKIFVENWDTAIFRTPKSLVEMLNDIFPTTDEAGVNYEMLAKAYMVLLYQGFTKDEIFTLKMDDIIVMPDCIVIKTGEKAELIYDEFREDVLRVYNNRHFCSLVHKKEIVHLPMGDYFISNGRNQTRNHLRTTVNQFIVKNTTKEFNMTMTIRSLYLMGQIYKMKKYENPCLENGGRAEQLVYKLLCNKW